MRIDLVGINDAHTIHIGHIANGQYLTSIPNP